ncbi:hypothetical protein ZWY2020_046001 [Hordeum vulgare]|nr:hypothetical protein ZWY2020_046001 [Hordeum vulgare]
MGSGGVVKHLVLARFKEEATPEALDQLIRRYAGLVDTVPSMKAFQWGADVTVLDTHEGFTHVFESTFESAEGVQEYIAHPSHVEFVDEFLALAEKMLIMDYKPAAAN